MRHCFRLSLIAILMLAPQTFAWARSATRPSTHASAKTAAVRKPAPSHRPRSKAACATCARDSKGRIARNPAAKSTFRKSHPCPSTGRTYGACPGFVIDHVKPLKRGGADSPGNMQWQTTAAAKAKDKIE
jgi:hypothetical protein